MPVRERGRRELGRCIPGEMMSRDENSGCLSRVVKEGTSWSALQWVWSHRVGWLKP